MPDCRAPGRRCAACWRLRPAPWDLTAAVAAELAGEGGDAPGLVDLHDLTRAVPSAANAAWYAQQVVDAYVRRTAAGMIGEAEAERNRDLPTADLLAGLEQRARHLRELHAGAAAAPVLVSAAEYAAAPQPAPVLWRDNPAAHDDSTDVDAVLSVGEVAILASAGGLGKSTLVLELASAAVAAAELGAASRLRVRPGRGRRPGGGGELRGRPGPDRAPAAVDERGRRARRGARRARPGAPVGCRCRPWRVSPRRPVGRTVARRARAGRPLGGDRPGFRCPSGREHDRDRPRARVSCAP